MKPVLALAGNPNCGKTTLFNRLTGLNQRVGNFSGVTVEVKRGDLRLGTRPATVVDLPGTYALSANSPEERLAADYLRSGEADVVIVVVDVMNLQRNLALALQVAQSGVPMVLALNMADELARLGGHADCGWFEQETGIAAVPISAKRGDGLAQLLERAFGACRQPPVYRSLTPDLETATRLANGTLGQAPDHSGAYRPDRLLLHRALALPIFLGVLLIVFSLTFGPPGKAAGAFLSRIFEGLGLWVQARLAHLGAPPLVGAFVGDVLFGGVGGVLSFIPQLTLLFFFITFMEDCGYMARAAMLMDRPLRRAGLSGKAFICMITGFGCSVPAFLSTRTLDTAGERRRTLTALPLVCCSARLPALSIFAGLFFPDCAGAVLLLMYGLSAVCAMAAARLSGLFHRDDSVFLLELPPYRMPSARGLLIHVWQRLHAFIVRAGTVIFAATAVIWALTAFTPSFSYTPDMSQSLFAWLSSRLARWFVPLGFGDWRACGALLAGLAAKESIVSALGMFYGSLQTLSANFSSASALSYMAFITLYTPCAAAAGALRSQLGSWRETALALLLQLALAYVSSAILYQIALFFR